MAEPQPQVMAAWVKVEDVLEWVPVRNALRAAFLGALGCEPDDPLRVIATMREELFASTVAGMRIGDAALTPVQVTKVELVRTICLKATGLLKTEADKQKDEEFKKDVELKKLNIIEDQAKAAAEQAKVATDTSKDSKNGENTSTVKLCTITDQTSDDVAPVLSRSEVTSYHKGYELKLDGKCPKPERPSVYQLSALKFLLGNDKSIYCDYAIWGHTKPD